MPVTEDQLKDLLAGTLHIAGGATGLDALWGAIIPSALDQAESDILGILHGRGYSDDQILMWPGLEQTVLTQALYWALVFGNGLQGADDRWAEKMDQRERLETLSIEALPAGPVGWGRILSESEFLKPVPEQEAMLERRGLKREFKKW